MDPFQLKHYFIVVALYVVVVVVVVVQSKSMRWVTATFNPSTAAQTDISLQRENQP
jgi:hypothetical protein